MSRFLLAATFVIISSIHVVAAPLKVSFLYVGSIDDLGWTYQHEQGRLALEVEFGDQIETSYVEQVSEGDEAEVVLTDLAMSGAGLIFTTSYSFMDATHKLAAKFPDVKFEHATGVKQTANISTYAARFYEGRAVAGHIAGKMTKSNVIGYIASYPIPEVIRGINSAYIHARRANPNVRFVITWLFTWFDPEKEAEAATKLIDEGADVLLQHTDSTAAVAVAEEMGVFAIGQSSDMKEFGPTSHLTAIIDNWSPYYVRRTQAVLDGNWSSSDTWHGIKDGMIEIGDFSDQVPRAVKAEAKILSDSIASGVHHPFTGPINRQDGSTWLAEGQSANDVELLQMDFFVEGLEGIIPN